MSAYSAINEMNQLLSQISPLINRLAEVVDDPSMAQDLNQLAKDFVANPTKEMFELIDESVMSYDYAKLIVHVDEDDNYIDVWSGAWCQAIDKEACEKVLGLWDELEY